MLVNYCNRCQGLRRVKIERLLGSEKTICLHCGYVIDICFFDDENEEYEEDKNENAQIR